MPQQTLFGAKKALMENEGWDPDSPRDHVMASRRITIREKNYILSRMDDLDRDVSVPEVRQAIERVADTRPPASKPSQNEPCNPECPTCDGRLVPTANPCPDPDVRVCECCVCPACDGKSIYARASKTPTYRCYHPECREEFYTPNMSKEPTHRRCYACGQSPLGGSLSGD